MKYGLDDIPPRGALLLYGLQWWVVTLPCVIITGVVTARLHYADLPAQVWYIRKLFAVMGAATVIQILFGHRLPLVIGPASVLLVGIIATLSSGVGALYTAIFCGGALLAFAGFANLLATVRRFFTPRIVAVVLILIAFTLSPTILRLITTNAGGGGGGAFSLCFALVMVFALALINETLKGVAKSLTVLIGMAGGGVAYCLFQGFPSLPACSAVGMAKYSWFISPVFEPGTLLAFAFCFLALTINEMGSVEAVGQMLKADTMDRRIRRGVGVTGLANMASGSLGVIGPVDFSLSAGLIAATGCASRYALLPAGLGLMVCALFPSFIMILGAIPGPVMGALLLYLMATQLSSGLSMLVSSRGVTDFPTGLVVGLPLMLGLMIAFAPAAVFDAFPQMLRPVIGNGFVMGTLSVIVMEHVMFRNAGAERKG